MQPLDLPACLGVAVAAPRRAEGLSPAQVGAPGGLRPARSPAGPGLRRRAAALPPGLLLVLVDLSIKLTQAFAADLLGSAEDDQLLAVEAAVHVVAQIAHPAGQGGAGRQRRRGSYRARQLASRRGRDRRPRGVAAPRGPAVPSAHPKRRDCLLFALLCISMGHIRSLRPPRCNRCTPGPRRTAISRAPRRQPSVSNIHHLVLYAWETRTTQGVWGLHPHRALHARR
jgi:hypothetical protein